VRQKIGLLASVLLLTVNTFFILGAAPWQQGGGVAPPQPFYADYFSGTVFLQSAAAPPGVQLVACVDECGVFQTEATFLGPGGGFHLMAVNPDNRRLKGRDLTFYLVNQYGRIKAAETRIFEGAYNISNIDLHFNDPLPLPPAPPTLPQVGDTFIPHLPKVLLALGATSMAGGAFLWAQSRRRRITRTMV
jgi:hypothetical protein